MRPGAGAFAAPPNDREKSPSTPQATQGVTPGVDPDFMQQLQQLGVLGGTKSVQPAQVPPKGQIPPPSVPDPLAQLSRLTGQLPSGGTRGTQEPATLATKIPGIPPGGEVPGKIATPSKGKFQPGKPGKPKSGMTAHQMMRDPAIVQALQVEVAAWENANPGRKLMGSHMAEIMSKIRPGTSPAQSRTALRLLNKLAAKETTLEERYQRGAYNALKG